MLKKPKWFDYVNTSILVFFLFSIFYLVKNVFFGENNYRKVEEYKTSIEKLKELLQREKVKNENLKKELEFLETYKREAIEIFIKDYLWKVEKGESVYLKKD